MPSATIKMFLVHGEPKRLRTAEISNWTGKAVAGPRSELESVLAREESQKSGIYFLTGNDPETGKVRMRSFPVPALPLPLFLADTPTGSSRGRTRRAGR